MGEQYYVTENPNSSAKVPRLNTDRKGLGQEFLGQPWGEGKLTHLHTLLGLKPVIFLQEQGLLSLHTSPNSLHSEWSRDNGSSTFSSVTSQAFLLQTLPCL